MNKPLPTLAVNEDCSDESSFSRFHDAQYITGFVAADVLDYTFPILKK